jgi:predicted amidohydrolase
MRVTVLELEATWGDPRAVLAEVEARISGGPATDLVLLPEASLTGYVSPHGDFDLRPFAEPEDGPTSRALSALARRRGVALVAPLILREGESCFNAMVIHDAEGRAQLIYRKRHPWYPETWAAAGPSGPPLLRMGDLTLTIAICFDAQFLELEPDSRAALAAADLLLFPSCWVDHHDSRTPLLARIARTFGVAVANANWAAGVVRVSGQGGAGIIGPDGAWLARARGGRADATVYPRHRPV